MQEITLRHLSVDDCTERYLSWLTDSYNISMIGSIGDIRTLPELRESISQRINDNQNSLIGIFEDENHIGNLQMRMVNNQTCIVSILIGEITRRGKGVGFRALETLIKNKSLWPKNSGKLNLYASIKKTNHASIKLFYSLGFKTVDDRNWPVNTINKNEDCLLVKLEAK